ncbi:coiled-coil domain-containing protein 183 [Elgaria multicarinata webbii]|uniref:coiled-coil domain-containing protein 183 n=1 Tax=Elgaria multicarinata webbii TaxID=159646 RepID=UPI002FCD1797
MRYQRKKDIKQQIHELRAIINLQEQVKKLFIQGSEETVYKNKHLITFLRGNVREGMHDLTLGLKYDHVTISRACREKKPLRAAFAEYTVEQARESLSSYVFDRMNAHNVLLYEVKRRGELLEGMQLRLQQLLDLETASPESQLQLQTIRQLENNIEKMHVKITTAEKTHMLYLKMLDVLREELSRLPHILDDLEQRVEVYQVELKGMQLMGIDTTEAMEAAKEDMVSAENELIAEKKFRENSLSIQKKQIERIRTKDASERHRRMQARRDMNMDFPNLMGREGTKGVKSEASKAQIEYQGLVTTEVDKIKGAVQCSHLWDIAGRFMAQKKSEENLQQQIAESEKKRRGLKAQLKQLELERAELKFHQTPRSVSSRKLEEELRNILEEEGERLAQVQNQVFKNQELLLLFENGVNNLIMRLCGITVPGQEDSRMETGDVFDKLQFCETKLMHLIKTMTKVPSYDFSQEESNESFVHVRNFLEESTRDERQNLRITFEEDDEDVRESFNFADIDHSYVPNREEIKKQGLKLIEDKTKITKKKQRGSSKK